MRLRRLATTTQRFIALTPPPCIHVLQARHYYPTGDDNKISALDFTQLKVCACLPPLDVVSSFEQPRRCMWPICMAYDTEFLPWQFIQNAGYTRAQLSTFDFCP